ncbi:damage-inducible protein [Corynebacterium phocae]|uniref:Damage-inducible protein n=1 Tax=Corynebacterium phocae TaxID=161895 RepID=A0A1L7D3F4_9CORY|nr:DEAD/DEAH box helicase [Corynebacterium phocae]APT92640.1 damage-inducible protein [Corynebacterium phocae]KAA8723887.1 DEAD/DEAH box helicase [Corynebacterium phocae]
MSTLNDVLEELNKIPDNVTRGFKFEDLMARYFKLHPVLSAQYDEVFRWKDWRYNGGRVDTGIDLVARDRESGEWTAVQCKFYNVKHRLAKSDIDSFFTESGKTFQTEDGRKSFSNRIIIATSDWSKNAEAALDAQSIPVQRIGIADIADAPIDWDIVYPSADQSFEVDLNVRKPFSPRPHQRQAIDAVMQGFTTHDRGKLIMACGTGKTFTALRLAEEVARNNGGRAKILFAVPSISLLGQTLREWAQHTEEGLRPFAVCSDKKVSKEVEDIKAYDLDIPVTTNGKKLAEKLASGGKRFKGLQVVFTTYQSMEVIHAAQEAGADDFDLVICDEAHRTTGVTLAGETPSAFTRVHDEKFIRAAKRLYMTATPRLFDDALKDKAAEHSAEISSMDDEAIYGPEFHRLGFGEAVDKGLLTDYKVLVLAVDEGAAAKTLQQSVANDDGELTLDDATKIIGCWNGLAKRSGEFQGTQEGFAAGDAPMKRAVAFAKDIKSSKQVAMSFPNIAALFADSIADKAEEDDSISTLNLDLRVEAQHVDGTMNAPTRTEKLRWLKDPTIDSQTTRILTNARCLSEGVDVPALDSVIFLNPRNSVVDVVQSVGRVMRKSPGKEYGYIILPIGIPAGTSPEVALADNKRFKVVWQVLNALRAHDDRFNAMVNSTALNSKTGKASTEVANGTDAPGGSLQDKVTVDVIGADGLSPTADDNREMATQLTLFSLEEWQEALYTRIVTKVGTRTYWEDWANDVADITQVHIERIGAILDAADDELLREFDAFVEGLRGNLNDSITRDDAISMLSQHLITAPVFNALFSEHDFAKHNAVSRVMQRMVDALEDQKLSTELDQLEGFYRSVEVRASAVNSADGKQQVVKDLYERFFQKAFKKQSESLGIVYTPVEIVDFILRAANDAMVKHFGRSLSDEGVHILDPFTGTGTFMVRLLETGLIKPEDLARKYANELHATEIMLLAYYVAAVNIEATYNALQLERAQHEGQETPDYVPFEGIALADTFQTSEEDDTLDLDIFAENNDKIERQKQAPIQVIVGNPPYSAGQKDANDNNQNLKYPTLDGRIEETYAALSTGARKSQLYDSYLRAFRWATDRIQDQGILAFVSNGGWLDGNTAAGVRLSFQQDFTDIYIYNLRGNARTAGALRQAEGGNVFSDNIRTTVAVMIGIKDPGKQGCTIHYRDIGDHLKSKEKLDIVDHSTLDNIDWETITPNKHGDWLNQRSEEFGTWPVIGDKKKATSTRIFSNYSLGLATNRDAFCYNSNPRTVKDNVTGMIDFYEQECQRIGRLLERGTPEKEALETLKYDSTKFKWDYINKKQVTRSVLIIERSSGYRCSMYRPFFPQFVYFDPKNQLNNRTYQLPTMFPTLKHNNIGFIVTGTGTTQPFSALGSKLIPNLDTLSHGQFFSRFTWEKSEAAEGELFGSAVSTGLGEASRYGQVGEEVDGYVRVDNITDEIKGIYREALGTDISGDDIFHFVYGKLHDPNYREQYEADLKKMLPHIETPSSRDEFDKFAVAGEQLMDLHVGYEDVEPWPLDIRVKSTADESDRETWGVKKMRWAKKTSPETGKKVNDTTTLIYNPKVTITDIPEEAEGYMLGSRSALAWIIDRYQVKKDKASGIVNDPNDWADEVGNPRYIVDLIGKVTRVAMETNRIVSGLR